MPRSRCEKTLCSDQACCCHYCRFSDFASKDTASLNMHNNRKNKIKSYLSLVGAIKTLASALKVMKDILSKGLVNWETSPPTNDTVSSLKWFLPPRSKLLDLQIKKVIQNTKKEDASRNLYEENVVTNFNLREENRKTS